MTLVTATRYSDLIACSVDIVGMSSLVTFLEHTEPYRRDLRRVDTETNVNLKCGLSWKASPP